MKAFTDAGMEPRIGVRTRVGGLEATKELDLLAQATRQVPFVPSGQTETSLHIRLTLRAVIEAKALDSTSAFVGFRWGEGAGHELRFRRTRFGGAPSVRVLTEFDDADALFLSDGGLAEALDPLNSGTACVQWAIARRKKDGDGRGGPKFFADHDEPYWKGLDTIVRASSARLREHCRALRSGETSVSLTSEIPMLVIATPTLYVFDAVAETLAEVDHLILTRQFEVDGEIVDALVDVVSEGGVPRMIERYKQAAEALATRVAPRAHEIVAAAASQRARLQEIARHSAVEAMLGAGNPF